MTSDSNDRPPFRADHVGSLLRPGNLTQAFRAFHKGEIEADAFRATQDAAIADVVKLQEDVGLHAITDGEFRRGSYWSHFVERIDGLTVAPARFQFRDDHGDATEFTAPHVSAKLERRDGISTDEFRFLSQVTERTPKITMPSPPTMHFWRGRDGMEPGVYDTVAEFFADLAAVYRAEIAELAGLGARYIQLDEVPLAMLCDPDVAAALAAAGEDPEGLVDQYIAAINDALADRPPALTAALHLCRGNFKGRHLSAGGYEAIAERLFQEIDVDGFFLEYDTPRAGDFAPLRFVPAGKTVVLGLISSKTPELEPIDELRRRVDEAAQYLPLEQLCLSPQCGFASTVAGNPLSEADEIAKLRLVVETAAEIWA